VAPGGVDTPMLRGIPQEVMDETLAQIPLGRLASPTEVASVVHFLTSEDSAYVTGQVLHVDGGITASP
jgi:3-oxoacyl-[acyl-carrier protein] reductase